jgi:signal transduction histidine kinase
MQPAVPTAAEPAAAATATTESLLDDSRVSAVVAVLQGAPLESTAARWSVDVTLLQRWITTFVVAGTAAVVNRPDPQAALARRRLLDAIAAEVAEPLVEARESARRLHERREDAEALAAHTAQLDVALDTLDQRVTDAHLLFAVSLGSLEIVREPITLGDLATGLGPVGALRGKEASYELDVDPELFARVVRDLWAAAGLSPRPVSRKVHVRVVGPWVEFRVLRVGDPIDTELLHALFEPFEHDRAEHPDADTGVTTGLYLARALTVAHGGTLGVDQDDLGSAFWVRVPARGATVSSTALARRVRSRSEEAPRLTSVDPPAELA